MEDRGSMMAIFNPPAVQWSIVPLLKVEK